MVSDPMVFQTQDGISITVQFDQTQNLREETKNNIIG